MSTEIKVTLTTKHEPSWKEILLLRGVLENWAYRYSLERKSLMLELDGEKVYES